MTFDLSSLQGFRFVSTDEYRALQAQLAAAEARARDLEQQLGDTQDALVKYGRRQAMAFAEPAPLQHAIDAAMHRAALNAGGGDG